ncbi:MAG: ACP S-malonyltransferase, partial [Pseudomonadota bacterium]
MNHPNQRILFLFPGQGSQYLGMGQDLYQAYDCVRQTYQEASEILGYDMAALSFEDPQEHIHLTRYTQPVLLTHSVACLRVFQELLARPILAEASAGHSLGEYTALVAAGALEFKTALNLVHHRGTLMGNHGAGEMEALSLGLKEAELLAEKHLCSIAACNLPDQTVVGGLSEDLDNLVDELTEQFPNKRSSRLKTEGAFHTYYMVEAARRFRLILDKAPLISPQIRVLSNYTGGFHDDDPHSIKSRLFWQLTNPVRWHENL